MRQRTSRVCTPRPHDLEQSVQEVTCQADGQSFVLQSSLVLGFIPQALLLAGVLSSDLLHLAERVRIPLPQVAEQPVQLVRTHSKILLGGVSEDLTGLIKL